MFLLKNCSLHFRGTLCDIGFIVGLEFHTRFSGVLQYSEQAMCLGCWERLLLHLQRFSLLTRGFTMENLMILFFHEVVFENFDFLHALCGSLPLFCGRIKL